MRKSLSLLFAAALAASAAEPIRAVIFSGNNNHDWRTTTPLLRDILQKTGRFDVRVIEEPAGVTAATLAGFDVIVLDYQGPRWGAATERAVLDFVNRGKGLVAVHAASYAFGGLPVLGAGHKPTGLVEPAWKEYGDMLGAVWVTDPKPATGHGPRHLFTVEPGKPAHPVTNGLEPFKIHDELYRNFRFRPGVNVIATAFDDPAYQGTGKNEPVLWTVNYGKGRVFHTILGHDIAAMQTPGFQASLARGAEWAATGAVTLPPQPAPLFAKDAVRVELITGGHDHDGTFYDVFEGNRDVRVTVNPHPDAFRKRVLKETDVIVLYDSVQELPEARKAVAKEFLESGKGMVVLHHAIVDFADWRWWWEEVVGGRYLLKPDLGMPASTYKHDQEMLVTVTGKHPITDGIGEFYISDETYKGMWRSPKITPLLATKHELNDPVVAWIAPYRKSRVVYIQLGHDRLSHQHPAFRALVHRAILWAAGRLPE
jgi:type 1 glutamine amidotransferase